MPHTAIASGGTRGLGRAIAMALEAQGYRVAATYHGNDAAAPSSQIETGIPIFKWDVVDFAEVPVQHLGHPADVARAVVFLATQEAGFIAGATLAVNGGQYMS